MDLLAMRPSEWRHLAQQQRSNELAVTIVEAIKLLLGSVQRSSDNGAEEAYVAAVELSNAGVWGFVDRKNVANILSTVRATTSAAFLDGLPPSVRSDIGEMERVERELIEKLRRSKQVKGRSGVSRGRAYVPAIRKRKSA